MIHRIQLSMITEDDDLYLNFIQPLKDNKELTPTILKLLEAYYRVPEVQQLIDFSSLEEVSVDTGDSESFDEALSKAKQTLAVMSLMADSASDIMNTGAVTIEEIIKQGTKIREETEVSEPTAESYKPLGMTETPIPEVSEPVEPTQSVVEDERLSKLENEVGSMKGMLEQLLAMVSSGKAAVSSQSVSQVGTFDESDFVENSVESVETPVETVDNSEVLDETEEINLFEDTVEESSVEEASLTAESDNVFGGEPVIEEEVSDVIPKIKAPLPKVKVDLGTESEYDEESTEDVLARASKLLGDSTYSDEVVVNDSVKDKSAEVASESTVEEPKSLDSEAKDGTSSLLSFLSNL